MEGSIVDPPKDIKTPKGYQSHRWYDVGDIIMSYTYVFGKCVAINDESVSIRFCLGVLGMRNKEFEREFYKYTIFFFVVAEV